MSKKKNTEKPIIGISGEYRGARKESVPFSWWTSGYYDCVSACGGLPMLLPPLAEDEDLRQFLSMLDGLVLAGCSLDLDPIRLGMEKHPSSRPMPIRREDFDRRLCKMAVEMKIPVLAIGSGMQTLNVVCGGTLHQHIPRDFVKPIHHRDLVEKSSRHVIDIVPGTRMDKIYGPGEIRVNSQHHMAVDQVANPFRVCAVCPDGVTEAYESIEEDWYCVGVQWHPQSDTSSALDMQVFESLMEACTKPEEVVVEQPEERNIIPMFREAA